MSSRKNQHFVPKFYLKKFSYKGNERQIGLFNISSKKFVATAPLKNEASKDFYYGRDGKVEEFLGNIEGKQAELLREVCTSLCIDSAGRHFELFALAIMMGLRNPVQIEHWKLFPEVMNTVNEEVYDGDLKSFFPPIEHEFIVDRAVALILEGIKFCFDLTIKLLVNKTAIPFILGDNPTVYYNQYLEKKKWPHSKCGWSTIGLQIFLPISPNITIMMYDDLFYRIGKHKSHIVDIEEVADVNSLNLLQILNCTSNVYFNENVSEGYITRLLQKSLRFPKPNQLRTSVKKLAVNDKIQEGDVIGFGKTDCEIGLDLKWIKPTAHNLNFVLGSRGLYMRPHPSILMNEAMKTMGPHLFNPDSAGENL